MNKAELTAKWGKYCDTNQLVDDMMDLLRRNNHRNSENGVCKLLDEFFTKKEPLIELISGSKNYKGNLRIYTTKEFDRQCTWSDLNTFFYRHSGEFELKEAIPNVDDDGKGVQDYLHTGHKVFNASEMADNATLMETCSKLGQFDDYGYLLKAVWKHQDVRDYVSYFRRHNQSTILANWQVDSKLETPLLRAGMKTSRAFNAFCHFYGLDKRDTYNKTFAQYADLVSELKRNMYFVISVNPLDYLTMSNGVSWASCHNIASGSYMGGCLSYMLDSTSMITFVVENVNGNIHNIPKNYRQMFHYNAGLFVQNRLYPQGNDGATNLYDKFRGFVTEEFADMLDGADDEWNHNEGSAHCRSHTLSTGTHYRDYLSNYSCGIFYPRSKANIVRTQIVGIGAEGVCVHCGRPFSSAGRLAHSSC